MYVCVPSFDPLRIYIFDDGLTRFATEPFTTSHKHLNKKFRHLTNFAINKKARKFQ